MKILLTFVVLITILIPQVLASTVSIVPQHYCNSARIIDISCKDVLRDRIVPIGNYLCDITAIIGR